MERKRNIIKRIRKKEEGEKRIGKKDRGRQRKRYVKNEEKYR